MNGVTLLSLGCSKILWNIHLKIWQKIWLQGEGISSYYRFEELKSSKGFNNKQLPANVDPRPGMCQNWRGEVENSFQEIEKQKLWNTSSETWYQMKTERRLKQLILDKNNWRKSNNVWWEQLSWCDSWSVTGDHDLNIVVTGCERCSKVFDPCLITPITSLHIPNISSLQHWLMLLFIQDTETTQHLGNIITTPHLELFKWGWVKTIMYEHF